MGVRREGPEGASQGAESAPVGGGLLGTGKNLKSNDLNVMEKKTPSNGEQSSSMSEAELGTQNLIISLCS